MRRRIDPEPDKCLAKIMAEHNIELAEIRSHNLQFSYTPRAKCYSCKDCFEDSKCKDYQRFECQK